MISEIQLRGNYVSLINDHIILIHQDEALNSAPWLNEVTWVPHCPTSVPDPTRREKKKEKLKPHASGSARTEGYYKQQKQDKVRSRFTTVRPPD